MGRSSHITTGDVLDDLGFSRSEASALKIKASILEAILAARASLSGALWICWTNTSRMSVTFCMAGSAR
jgi:hypothetical protein